MGHLLDLYLQDRTNQVTQRTLKPKTLLSDTTTIENYVRPVIGDIRCDRLTAKHVRELIEAQQYRQTRNRQKDKNTPMTNRTAQLCRTVIQRVIEQASKHDIALDPKIIRYISPSIASSRKKIVPIWTRVESNAFLDYNRAHRYYSLYAVALAVGMRKGELLGLHWCDVILENDPVTGLAKGTIHVQYNLQRITGVGLILDSPKTDSGERTIPIPHAAATALMAWREHQAKERARVGEAWPVYPEGEYVWPTPKGTPIEPRNLSRHFDSSIPAYNKWASTANAPQIKEINFHALRHTCATLLLGNRDKHTETIYVQHLLGHSSITVTSDLYSHVIQRDLNDTISASMNHIFK